jgi:hypothetical protein
MELGNDVEMVCPYCGLSSVVGVQTEEIPKEFWWFRCAKMVVPRVISLREMYESYVAWCEGSGAGRVCRMVAGDQPADPGGAGFADQLGTSEVGGELWYWTVQPPSPPLRGPHGEPGPGCQPRLCFASCPSLGDQRHPARLPVSLRIAQAR